MSTVKSRPPVGQSPVQPGTDHVVSTTTRVLLLIGTFLGLWLAISGVVLAVGEFRRGVEPSFWQVSHQWAGYALTVVTILAAPVGLALSMFRLKLLPVAVTTASIVFAIALGSTGRWLASFELVNGNGAERSFLAWLFRPGVRFFVLGEGEISATVLRVLTLGHFLLLPLILGAAGARLSRYLRRTTS